MYDARFFDALSMLVRVRARVLQHCKDKFELLIFIFIFFASRFPFAREFERVVVIDACAVDPHHACRDFVDAIRELMLLLFM